MTRSPGAQTASPRTLRATVHNPGGKRTTYLEGTLPFAFVSGSKVPLFRLEQSGILLFPVETLGVHGVRCIGLATLTNKDPNLVFSDSVRALTQEEGEAVNVQWEATDWVRDRIEGLIPKVRAKVQGPIDTEPVWYRIVPQVALVADHPLEQRWRIFGRCAEFPQLMIEAEARIRSHSDEIEIAGSVLNSLAGTKDGDVDLLELELVTSDLLWLDNAKGLGFGVPAQRKDIEHDVDPPMLEWAVPLTTRPVHLGCWQGIDFRGAILAMPNDVPIGTLVSDRDPITAARVNNLSQRLFGKAWFVADYSADDDGWLAHKFVPKIPSSEVDATLATCAREVGRVEAWLQRDQAGVMDSRPIGTTPNNNGSGDQEDFGLGKVVNLQTVLTPALVPMLLACASEGLRPTHFREADGSRVTADKHPQLVLWSQVPHWHRGVSVDQLGKEPGTPGWTSNYQGKDKQHLSSNVLAAGYAATGDFILGQHVRDEIEAALMDVREHVDSPRGQGRPLHVLANHYLLTADPRVLDEIALRVRQGFTFWEVQNPWCNDPTRTVRPFGRLTDPRTLTRWDENTSARVPVECWSVWETGLAFEGYLAAWRVLNRFGTTTLHDTAEAMAYRLAHEAGALIVRQGFFRVGTSWTLAANVRIEPDAGTLTPASLYQIGGTDGVMTEPGFWEWCIGAVSWLVEQLPSSTLHGTGLGGYTFADVVDTWDRAAAILRADVLPVPKGAPGPTTRSLEWRRSSRLGARIDELEPTLARLRAELLAAIIPPAKEAPTQIQ